MAAQATLRHAYYLEVLMITLVA